MRNIDEIVNKIKNADTWDFEACAELCAAAGLSEDWENADGDTFENVVYRAAAILNVEI